MCRSCQLVLLALFAGLPVAQAQDASVLAAQTESAPTTPASRQDPHAQPVYAVINGRVVPRQEYEAAFTSLVRQRFYHGKIPDTELAAVREEIKVKLVQRIVLLEEAERRKILPDEQQIAEVVAGYEKRYATSPQWRESREALLPELMRDLAEQSQIAQLDKQVRDVGEPAEADVRGFYDRNPALFTEPEKLRMSVIMLAVPPSSPNATWDSTREEARAIYKRLSAGASFEETARLHSNVYSENGGDMGYLHRGMLPEVLQETIDKFAVGVINEPMDTLEGVAIFRVQDRLTGKKRDFADVASRARELLIRERQDKAWKSLVDRLVAKANVKFMQVNTMEQREAGQK
jgi:parvulin-like peptidyl-prolyl isomerase